MVDNVIIMSCEDRRDQAERLARLAYQKLQSKTCVIIDAHNARRKPKHRNVWRNYLDCLTQAITLGGEWTLILQDDIKLHPQIGEALNKIIETCPEEDVIGLCHLTNKFYNEALLRGDHVVRTYSYTYSLGILWHRSAIEHILRNKAYCNIGRHDDRNICRWSLNRDKPIPTVLPSFIQHDDTRPSTLGNGLGKWKGRRMSNSYDPKKNIVDIDWSRAFSEATVDKSISAFMWEETSHERFARFAQERNWKWAKTYAKNAPHWYTVRQDAHDRDFWAAVLHIEMYGYDKQFWRRSWRYYDHEGHHYWVNEAGHPDVLVINRTIINQDELSRVQQEQIEAGNVR